MAGEGGLTAQNLVLRSDGIDFDALLNGRQVPVSLGIPGKFTVYNALTVLGLAVSLGISLEDAAAALANAQEKAAFLTAFRVSVSRVAAPLLP